MERTEAMSEMRARDTLYGPQTRSGQVTLTPLQPDEYGRPAGLHDTWADWGSITWDWPENPEKALDAISNRVDDKISSIRVYHLDDNHRISSIRV